MSEIAATAILVVVGVWMVCALIVAGTLAVNIALRYWKGDL